MAGHCSVPCVVASAEEYLGAPGFVFALAALQLSALSTGRWYGHEIRTRPFEGLFRLTSVCLRDGDTTVTQIEMPVTSKSLTIGK